MTQSQQAFWSVIVQLIPVLSLAWVISVRRTSKQLTEGIPRWYRVSTAVWVGLTMLGFVLAEMAGLAGLLLDEAPPQWIGWAATWSVAASFPTLLFEPLGELVARSAPLTIARLAAEPFAHFKSVRRVRRMQSMLGGNRDDFRAGYLQFVGDRASAMTKLEKLDPNDPTSAAQRDLLLRIVENCARGEEIVDKVIIETIDRAERIAQLSDRYQSNQQKLVAEYARQNLPSKTPRKS